MTDSKFELTVTDGMELADLFAQYHSDLIDFERAMDVVEALVARNIAHALNEFADGLEALNDGGWIQPVSDMIDRIEERLRYHATRHTPPAGGDTV